MRSYTELNPCNVRNAASSTDGDCVEYYLYVSFRRDANAC